MAEELKDPFGFRPLWDALIDIYTAVAKVCDAHGLRYYVAYGTALGAVRHQGFIPWDDDFDVQMPREDYERFINNYAAELESPYKIVNCHNERRFHWAFTKIMLSDAKRVQEIENKTGVQQNQGIFVDIFPLDGFHEGRLKFKIWWFKYLYYRVHQWHFENYHFTSVTRIFKRVMGIIAHLTAPWIRDVGDLARRFDRISKEVPYRSGKFVGYVANPTFYKPKIHLNSDFDEPRELQFDNIRVKVPANIDNYLRIEYGDYMRMPPESKRVPHHLIQPVAPWRFGADK